MTLTDLAVLVIGAALVVGGVALVYVPAALILAGIGLLALGLLRNANTPDDDEEPR